MEADRRPSRWLLFLLVAGCIASHALLSSTPTSAQDGDVPAAERPAAKPLNIDFVQLFHDGGMIGYIICLLSVVMVEEIIRHLLIIRRGTMIPPGLPEELHKLISTGQYKAADELCKSRPSFLSYMIAAALPEVPLGYAAVEKAMEDAAAEQSARLLRKIEYLSIISTVAPMLGLMGTVWGMILAFMEFERKANPQISELAPGVYKALVTTLQGLIVAIPAISAFAFFRNRIDELVAQTSLMAEHIFADFKRSSGSPRRVSAIPPERIKRPEERAREGEKA